MRIVAKTYKPTNFERIKAYNINEMAALIDDLMLEECILKLRGHSVDCESYEDCIDCVREWLASKEDYYW